MKIIDNEGRKMKNADSHIFLYAKHHYKATDTIEDLKKIISVRSMIPVEYINKENILSVLSTIAYPYINKEWGFQNFMEDILPQNAWKTGGSIEREKNQDFELNIIRKLLSVISLITVNGENGNILIELDEPDSSILPLRDKFNSEL
jgi:hypothetical protein